MDIHRILLATDFSDCSSAALDVASRLASETGARLYIVHVNGLVEISIPAIPQAEPAYYDAPWAMSGAKCEKGWRTLCRPWPMSPTNTAIEPDFLWLSF